MLAFEAGEALRDLDEFFVEHLGEQRGLELHAEDRRRLQGLALLLVESASFSATRSLTVDGSAISSSSPARSRPPVVLLQEVALPSGARAPRARSATALALGAQRRRDRAHGRLVPHDEAHELLGGGVGQVVEHQALDPLVFAACAISLASGESSSSSSLRRRRRGTWGDRDAAGRDARRARRSPRRPGGGPRRRGPGGARPRWCAAP